MFLPDYILETYRDLTPELLASLGINTLILDIDNTLVPYEIEHPTPELVAWFSDMAASGVKIAFVSNNDKRRVELFNSSLSYIAFYKSKKPLPGTLKKALCALNSEKNKTAMMGDQIFTDILSGNCMGFVTFLVPPIKDKTDAFTKAKRFFEKPFIKKYHKRMEKMR